MVLPPYIIEQIRKREKRRRQEEQRPAIRLPIPGEDPLDRPPEEPPDSETDDDDDNRGVVIIDL
ncbi:MAG: hypothetical protein U9Q03_01190 [Patescibacteria group bacterium]|nr:hypothetical protein [Patescibacteria group bacterium]